MELSVGQIFGDYEILGILGKGGMGKVYQVRNRISNRVEAMKILLSDLTAEAELVDRFTREIRIFGSLDHPNITELRTALRVENQLVMIMEYVEGATLDALMKQGRIPMDKYLDYMSQALSALSYAHSKGVVHRDIKPANMMLTPSGVLKLMDFGIAKAVTDPKLTKTGFMVGSVYYVSPEQIEGKEVDARSDLYSLGVTLYELATGKRPFDGTSDYQIISAHMKQNPPPPRELDASLPSDLNDLILLALAKDPAARFQTADAFKNAIAGIVSARMPQASLPAAAAALPPITPSPAVAAKRNTRLLYMLVGSAATIAVIAGAVIELPKMLHTSAAGQTASRTPTPTPAPAPAPIPAPTPEPVVKESAPPPQQADAAPSPTPVPPAVPATHPPVSTPAAPKAVPAEKKEVAKLPQKPVQVAQTPAQPSTPPAAQPQRPVPQPQPPAAQPTAPPANAAAVSELQERANLMSVRVGTVRSSLQNLQRQQAASGLGLRSDMVAADQRVGYQMQEAQTSLQQGDVTGAKKRLDAAERDLEKLEDFLGK